METIELLDVVALRQALPDAGLVEGRRGTVVELLSGDAYLVEFSNDDGEAEVIEVLRAPDLRLVWKRAPGINPRAELAKPPEGG